MEIRKIFRAGNSLVVSLPREALERMGLAEGSRLILTVEPDRRALVFQPLQEDLLDIAREVIDEYRPFLASPPGGAPGAGSPSAAHRNGRTRP